MPATTTNPESKTYPAELEAILQRADRGDATVMPELIQAFDQNPELVARFGDLVSRTEQILVNMLTGSNLKLQEAIGRQVAELRAELGASASSRLEKLIIDRISVSWLEVYLADIEVAAWLQKGQSASPGAQVAQRRLDSAHRRFLSAVKQLAIVQKLVRLAPSPLDLLKHPVRERGVDGIRERCSRSVADGAPVSN